MTGMRALAGTFVAALALAASAQAQQAAPSQATVLNACQVEMVSTSFCTCAVPLAETLISKMTVQQLAQLNRIARANPATSGFFDEVMMFGLALGRPGYNQFKHCWGVKPKLSVPSTSLPAAAPQPG